MAGSISGRTSGARETARQGLHLKQFYRGIDIDFVFRKDQGCPLKGGDRQLFHRAHLSRLHRGFGRMLFISSPTDSTAFSLSTRVSTGSSSRYTT